MHTFLLAARSSNGDSSPIFFWIVGPVMIVIGLATAIRPDLAWRMSRWQYRDKKALEPSKAGLVVQRLTGVAFVVVGIVLLVVGATR